MAADRRLRYRKRGRLRQLRAFCEAAQLRSMTKAAERLQVSQPAVSLHIRELEHELGAVLFERNGPRISLSPAGERFFELAAPLVEGTDGLARELAGEPDQGELRVASGDLGASYVLPRACKRLGDDYPGIRVHLKSCPLGDALELLLAGAVELVLGSKEPVSAEIEYRPVLSCDVVVIAPPDHPLAGRDLVTLEEIDAWPVVTPDSGHRQGRESLLRHLGTEANAEMMVSGWDVIETYVAAGFGIALCPSLCIADESRVSVVPLRQDFGKLSYGWFTRRGKPLSRLAERLVEAVAAEAPGAPCEGAPPG